MYGMVVMMALSQSPAVGQEVAVRPDHARYGNQLQSEHNRILGGRRNCGSSCGTNNCCSTGYGMGYSGCGTSCGTSCGTACATNTCATGSCVSNSCGTCASNCCPTGRVGLFRGRRGSSSNCNTCCAYEPGLASGTYTSFYAGNLGDAAMLIVNLPADASLTIDGAPTQTPGARRVFVTPSLPQGKEFTYELKARVMKDGKEQTKTEKVKVKAGQETPVTLTFAGEEGARRLP